MLQAALKDCWTMKQSRMLANAAYKSIQLVSNHSRPYLTVNSLKQSRKGARISEIDVEK